MKVSSQTVILANNSIIGFMDTPVYSDMKNHEANHKAIKEFLVCVAKDLGSDKDSVHYVPFPKSEYMGYLLHNGKSITIKAMSTQNLIDLSEVVAFIR